MAVSTESGAYLFTREKGERKLRRRTTTLKGENVNSTRYDPRHGRLYAATHSNGVFVSEDLGKSWKEANKGLHVRKTWTVELDPRRPATVYAGTQYGHLFRSDDSGGSWEEVTGLFEAPGRRDWGIDWGMGTTGLCIHTIKVDPKNGKRIFIVASGNGPYRSNDGGKTWKRLLEGVQDRCPLGRRNAPSIPTQEADSELRDHLKQVHSCTHKLALSTGNSDVLYQQNHCGVYLSRNGGDSWEDVSPQPATRHGFPIVMTGDGSESILTVPAYQGPQNGGCKKHNSCIRGQLAVLRSDDSGKTWRRLTDGLPNGSHTCVLRDAMAADEDGVYIGTTTGEAYVSWDSGESWSTVVEGVPRIQGISSFEVP